MAKRGQGSGIRGQRSGVRGQRAAAKVKRYICEKVLKRLCSMPPSGSMWLPPPSDLSLSDDVVHVWRASLDQPAALVERMAGILSEDERTRAARFFFERDRQHFIVARGALRMI